MGKKPNGYWTIDRCKESAKGYSTRKGWQSGCRSAYATAQRNGWLDDCCHHMPRAIKPNGYWTLPRCKESAKGFGSRSEWEKGDVSAYIAARRNGWIDACCHHMPSRKRPNGHWTVDRCKESAGRFKTRSDWVKGEQGSYVAAQKSDWLDDCCEHMSRPKVSSFEENIRDLLVSNGVEFETNIRVNNREFDIVVDSHNLLIECNGLYWHSDNPRLGASAKAPTYHRDKTRLAQSLGYRCLHIWEHEQDLPAMRSLILAACGKASTIHARKTRVVPLEKSVAKVFLNDHHVQGYGRFMQSRMDTGLMLGDDLVAVMSFTPAEFRHGDGKADWTLARYATPAGHRVAGGASKLFKRRPSGSIISYSDSRVFDGGMYDRLGFVRDGESAPDYFYTRQGCVVQKRAAQRKKLPRLLGDRFDPGLSERDNMKAADFHKVHDCGKVRWIFHGD